MARLTHWEGEPVSVWTVRWGVPVFEAYNELGSTSDRLTEIAAQGAGPGSVIISETQTAGRGRRSTTWHSPADSGLWMSVLLPAPSPSVAYLPLMAGLVTARAIEHLTPGIDAGIEWPNDIVISGKKVAGVLCEAVAGGLSPSVESVLVGIGVNVRTPQGGFPADIRDRATSLEDAAEACVSRAALAGMIIAALASVLGTEGMGKAYPHGRLLPPQMLKALNRRDVLSDQWVHSEQEGPGIARGILESGALLLEREDGSRVDVVTGSVRLI